MLACPVCHKDMIILELESIEIDACLLCHGIWLDAGELELLLNNRRPDSASLFTEITDEGFPEEKRTCPVCGRKMKKMKANTAAGEALIADECPEKHGFWFDKGELAALLSYHTDLNHPVVQLLKDMFAYKITEGGSSC